MTKASMSTPVITLAIAKRKDNPCTKSGVGKCYRYSEPGHRFNEYPKRSPVNMADIEEEDDVLIKTEPEDSDFIKEHGKPVLCCSEGSLQSEDPRHYTTAPKFLFKVFSQR